MFTKAYTRLPPMSGATLKKRAMKSKSEIGQADAAVTGMDSAKLGI
jgi:hypothetical protein